MILYDVKTLTDKKNQTQTQVNEKRTQFMGKNVIKMDNKK